MKVILLDNIKKIGQKGQVIEVNDGYGNNFLIKRGLAKKATEADLKNIKKREEEKQKSKEIENKKNEEIFQKINKKRFSLKQKASDKGHLFGAVHKKDIAEVVGVDEKNIILEHDIKELGEYEVKIKLGDLKAKIILLIEGLE